MMSLVTIWWLIETRLGRVENGPGWVRAMSRVSGKITVFNEETIKIENWNPFYDLSLIFPCAQTGPVPWES
jgi:hypothetical protein